MRSTLLRHGSRAESLLRLSTAIPGPSPGKAFIKMHQGPDSRLQTPRLLPGPLNTSYFLKMSDIPPELIQHQMYVNLRLAAEVMGFTHMCPSCRALLKEAEYCTIHCRQYEDEIHKGLALRSKKDFPEFHRCYRLALKSDVTISLRDEPNRQSGRRNFRQVFRARQSRFL